MRIVHIISGLSVGGAEMMLYRMIQSAQKDGTEHTVISLSSVDMIGDRIRSLGVDVRLLGMQRGLPNPFLILKLIQWLVDLRPDIVQTWMYHADLFGGVAACLTRAILKWRMPSGNRLRLVWGVHQTEFPAISNNRKLGAVAKCCALLSSRVPDTIVCCAEAAMRTHIGGGYCMRRMQVIYNGFDVDLFKPGRRDEDPLRKLLSLDMHAPIVGIVGRDDPAKDYGNFVAAVAKVSPQWPGCHFVMIGKGLDENNTALRSLIEQAGVSRVCHLVGPRSDLHDLIPGFDLFCLSSRSEGLPTVVGEAMACGVPCVATDVGDTRLLVGETGRLVKKSDPDALATALLSMLGLPAERRQRLGLLARERIETHFSITASWLQYKRAYTSETQT